MASIGDSRTGTRNQGRVADLIVKGAIALVTVAFFIGAYLQFRVAFWLALIAALSVYITLLILHALMRRSERVDALVSEVSRLEDELSRMRPSEEAPAPAWQRPPIAARPQAVAPPPPPAPAEPFAQRSASPPLAVKAPPVERVPRPVPQAQPPLSPPPATAPVGLTLPGAPAPAAPRLSVPPPPPPPLQAEPRSEAPLPGDSSMRDYWAFRPTKPTLPDTSSTRRKEAPPTAAEREADLDAVQGMIKRLADEVSLGADAAGERMVPSPETIARASVDALNTTASTMRAASAPKAPSAAPRSAPPSMPPPIAPAHARLSSLAAALATGRMDVLVEPIMGLGDQLVHYYEAIVCPRDEHGMPLHVAAHDPQLARTGLRPLLDGARLKRAAQACRMLANQRQKHCVLTAVSGEALATDAFLDELAGAYREREALAGELVLTFSQADVKGFSGTEWSNLTDMRDLGFRFGLDQTMDMDYEFSALRAAGFAFVKIDAATFLQGLPAATGMMAPDEVCRSLAELGLVTMVEGIDSEATRAKVVASGVTLGQGPLFGPPQLIASDAVGTAAA